MIYGDPTEFRKDSVIPDGLVAASKELPGLESLTGADFLICTDTLDDIKSPVGKIVLKRRLETGVLIQRKSGADLLGSISDLSEILARMQEWQESPWLVVTRISEGPRDTVKVSGTRRRNNWRWSSVSGALDSWQDRGGCVKVLATDHDLTAWFRARERQCENWERAPEKAIAHRVKQSKQKLRRVDPSWYNTRLAWPRGIGESQLTALARYINSKGRPPTLANAISLACSKEVLSVRGWGKKSMNNVRAWYGVTGSVRNMEAGAPTWCMMYDWHEGILVLEGDELYRAEKVKITDAPEGAIVLERSE